MLNRVTEKHLFYFLLLLHLIYLWWIPVFLTQDGPSHLYNSSLLLNFNSPASHSFYSNYFILNLKLFPNWFSNVILSCLLILFKPLIAEKVFLSLIIFALPCAFRFALKAIHPNSVFLSSLIFIFTNSYFLIYGFYNFQWSIVFFCLFIGLYNKQVPSVINFILLCLLPPLIFFTHPVALIVLVFFVCCDSLKTVFYMILEKGSGSIVLSFFLRQCLIFVPSILLFFFFMAHQSSESGSLLEYKFNLHYFKMLFSLSHQAIFSVHEKIVFLGFTLLFVLLFFLCALKIEAENIRNKTGSFVLTFIFCLLVYFFISDRIAGGAYLTTRMLIFIYILFLFFAATLLEDFRYKKFFTFISCAATVCILLIRFPVQYEIGKKMQAYLSMGKNIPDNSTLLPLGFSNHGEIGGRVLSPQLALFRHIGDYVGACGSIVCFDNYEANTNYFPLIWKKDLNPYLHISKGKEEGLESNPPVVDLLKYSKKGNIDYVLLWGDPFPYKDSASFTDLCFQLKSSYDFLSSSSDGLARLYKNKSLSAAVR